MTEKTRHLGRQTGESSDKYMSPQRPYTGDGSTTRQPHDPVTLDRPAPETGRS
jgi:hypothetical protein